MDIESEVAVMDKVRAALHGRSVRAYREAGVKDGYALVFASERKKGVNPPVDDYWSVYSVALDTGKADLLIGGFQFGFHSWIGRAAGELPLEYVFCIEECEGGALFTTLHLQPKVGWRARWGSNNEYEKGQPIPGIRMDCGEPTGGQEVFPPVFAVFNLGNDGYQVGRWCRIIYTSGPAAGKVSATITDEVMRYSVDAATGKEKEEKLTGAAARDWKSHLCQTVPVAAEISSGRNSKLCQAYRKTVPDAR